jgi:hypothetical protein
MRRLKLLVIGLSLLLSSVFYLSDFQLGESYGQQAGIRVKYLPGSLPLTAPESRLWTDVSPVEMALGPQLTGVPWTHPEPSIRSVNIKALHNSSWISFRLTWKDDTKNSVMVSDTFRDAAAVMLSLEPGAGQCMGTPSANALIAHWKADWQKDVEDGFTDIAQLYPNFWSDWYIHAVGNPPYDLPDVYQPNARAFVGGWAVGNALSNPFKLTPVETVIARGFGTLSSYEFQSFVGRGTHSNGEWQVVISRPIATGHADPPWSSTKPLELTLAVWDGAKKEVGPKKGVSIPMPLSLEGVPEAPSISETIEVRTLGIWEIATIAGTFALSLSIVSLIWVMNRKGKAGVIKT